MFYVLMTLAYIGRRFLVAVFKKGVRSLNIILNGKKTEIEKPVTIMELLESKGIDHEKVIIEYNYDILIRDDWSKTVLKENDVIEVLRFVGGG